MGWVNLEGIVEGIRDDGRISTYSFRKTPQSFTQAGNWYDLSITPGNPNPNYFVGAPLTADVLPKSVGLQVGGNVAPRTKHLKELLVMSNSANGLPVTLILCDYVMFYSVVDQSETSPQIMDNTVTLPRYISGEGLQAIAVMTAPSSGGTAVYDMTYVNSKGVTRTQTGIPCTGANALGTILSTQAQYNVGGPFVQLQPGDTGIRSITSITMTAGEVGLMSFALVKPLATVRIVEQTAPVEVCFLRDQPSMPKIEDGAILGFISCASGNMALTTFLGTITTIWG